MTLAEEPLPLMLGPGSPGGRSETLLGAAADAIDLRLDGLGPLDHGGPRSDALLPWSPAVPAQGLGFGSPAAAGAPARSLGFGSPATRPAGLEDSPNRQLRKFLGSVLDD
jgi:hypothetical protein